MTLYFSNSVVGNLLVDPFCLYLLHVSVTNTSPPPTH